VLGAATGGAFVLASFLEPGGAPPARYRFELLAVGLLVGGAAFADLRRRALRSARVSPPPR
jgi:hypothetical protein